MELVESSMVWVARDVKAHPCHGQSPYRGRTPKIHIAELLSTPQLHVLPQDSVLRWNNFLVFQLPGGFPVTRSSW